MKPCPMCKSTIIQETDLEMCGACYERLGTTLWVEMQLRRILIDAPKEVLLAFDPKTPGKRFVEIRDEIRLSAQVELEARRRAFQDQLPLEAS